MKGIGCDLTITHLQLIRQHSDSTSA
jgi:hypothetical protein